MKKYALSMMTLFAAIVTSASAATIDDLVIGSSFGTAIQSSCGYQIAKSGNHLILSAIDNSQSNQECPLKGDSAIYQCTKGHSVCFLDQSSSEYGYLFFLTVSNSESFILSDGKSYRQVFFRN